MLCRRVLRTEQRDKTPRRHEDARVSERHDFYRVEGCFEHVAMSVESFVRPKCKRFVKCQ